MAASKKRYSPKHPIRIVTATALFDGHDAAINIFRRILQDNGAEVIHLGHNRSVDEIVDAAVQEDVQGVAVSSYQGGHMEFFKYLMDRLRDAGAPHVKVFGGGGGVIVPAEIDELQSYGVTQIYSPEDGARLGLQGIVTHMLRELDFSRLPQIPEQAINIARLTYQDKPLLANLITLFEQAKGNKNLNQLRQRLTEKTARDTVPVIGITGTGGSGKSSLTDELILRWLKDQYQTRIAVLSVDPSRRKTGGALLGDRIRMNAIANDRIFMRSLATRQSNTEIPPVLPDTILAVKAAGFDIIFVETAGIGQGDSRIIDLVDLSVYVMTSEFGAASQLEKIDMLDFADLVVINKFEKQGSQDALRDVRKQVQRNRTAFDQSTEKMPVFGTTAAKFNDDGVTALYHALGETLAARCGIAFTSTLPRTGLRTSSGHNAIIAPERDRYLSDISQTVRRYHVTSEQQSQALRRVWHLEQVCKMLNLDGNAQQETSTQLQALLAEARQTVAPESRTLLTQWQTIQEAYRQDQLTYNVRDGKVRTDLFTTSLAHSRIPKIALPAIDDPGALYRWLRREHLPGHFPYTAGVFPLKRTAEDPTRMFAGEGDPTRTNQRFKLLSTGSKAKRLSTAFDSVTLYGFDPDLRPDIYGKIGNAGVNVSTLDDVKTLYDGFDLCAPNTSVSMTINGPAPIILAMFFNTAIEQQVTNFKKEQGREPSAAEYAALKTHTLSTVRGTVQADILKEDQGQNTCIFSIDFALKMMGDIQDYFVQHNVRNFYSVSISGYHIAEAGANPISQLAFTLANGFTYLEYYLTRGMSVDSVAPNLSFFFSNGMDPEYTVIGRVARRIWAIALRDRYGANARSQMLKYHIQTSGRSLHSQEIQFNDIRTTLQALCAVYDNCQSLHTNAFDEAITTPSEASVRRALAIQQIIQQEWGLAKNENPLQGSFIVDELTDLVEEAVLLEFDRISARGGVLGAMETGYQRSKIQEESIYYETLKHTGKLPIIGVNTFRDPHAGDKPLSESFAIELARSTNQEKQSQLDRLNQFHKRHAKHTPRALARLQETVLSDGNIFETLMETVHHCSLGQITQALYAVGGRYRRSM